MKKSKKIIAGSLAFLLIGGILVIANQFVGNPASKFIVNRRAPQYIKNTYPSLDLEVSKASYNFKTGGYDVFVESPSSMDTHFNVEFSPTGKIHYDSYENDVAGKWNTWIRVGKEYRDMVQVIFGAQGFPYKSDIDFGDLKLKEEDSFGPVYGLELGDLELDEIYDVKELAKTSGQIVLDVQDDQISPARASEILLHIKEIFDDKDVPFYAIDFTLEAFREEGRLGDEDTFSVNEFLYSDIYEEGLIERLEKASSELDEFYKNEDKKMEKIID